MNDDRPKCTCSDSELNASCPLHGAFFARVKDMNTPSSMEAGAGRLVAGDEVVESRKVLNDWVLTQLKHKIEKLETENRRLRNRLTNARASIKSLHAIMVLEEDEQ